MSELDTQEIRESYIPCRCEQSGQHLLWLWAALDEIDRLRDGALIERLAAIGRTEPNPRVAQDLIRAALRGNDA